MNREGAVVGVNRRAEELFGTTANRLLGRPVEVLLPARLRPKHAQLRWTYSRLPTVRAMSTRPGLMALRADGSEFPVEVQLTPVPGSETGLVLAVVHDVGARSAVVRALEAPDRSTAALDAIGDAILTTDAAGEVDFLNHAAERLTGRSRLWARGRRVSEVLGLGGDEAGERLELAVAECLRTGETPASSEAVLTANRGEEARALDLSATAIRDPAGGVTGVALVARDVTHARLIVRQLSHQATHDALTGLVNRREFERRLARVLASAARDRVEHAVCFLDLDGFKRVNDTCGHHAGDELLRQLSELMRQRMRSRDTLARLGGDEFGVLLEHCRLRKAARIAEQLREAVCDHRFVFEGDTYAVGVSIGVVPVRADGERPADVLRDADSACYLAKRHGGGRIQVHDRRRESGAPSRQRDWTRSMLAAIEADRLQLWAQPLLPLDRAGHRAPRLELLLRLEAAQADPLLPGAFLPAARRHGLMPRIDRWVAERAVHRLAEWQEMHPGEEPPAVAINLGEETVAGDQAGALVREALAGGTVAPGTFCFEIGEAIAASHSAASDRLVRELRDAGCQVTLEHCGSGISAFTLLRRLPVNYLKVAGQVVRGVAHDPVDRVLVTALNDAGHALGLGTIATQVESAEVLAELRRMGLDFAQGYEIGRPEPLEGALARLSAWRDDGA